VILSCCSANKSRFKLVVFDASGGVRYVQESAPTGDKKYTTATMYLVPFETITSFGPCIPQFNEEPGASCRQAGWSLPSVSCRRPFLTRPLNYIIINTTQPSSSASTR
jgi:hypothetical protein